MSEFKYSSIGILSSCFRSKFGTPRQGMLVPSSKAFLKLTVPPISLNGLHEYSHVWLIAAFDTTSFLSRVRPPKMGTGNTRTGVYSTRSPNRFNKLALSLARLERVDDTTLTLSGIDLIDGTPIIDIKPYHPTEAISCATFPRWVDTPPPVKNVVLSSTALSQVEAISLSHLKFFDSKTQLRQTIVQALALDPRTHIQISKDELNRDTAPYTYKFYIDNLLVTFESNDHGFEVISVTLLD